jgi:hypothetical protein
MLVIRLVSEARSIEIEFVSHSGLQPNHSLPEIKKLAMDKHSSLVVPGLNRDKVKNVFLIKSTPVGRL